jgi:hypothetical protein
MGGGASVQTPDELSAAVAGLGSAYDTYAKAVHDNGIDGKLLAGYTNVDSLLADLGIEATNALHKKKLAMEFDALKATSSSAAGGVGGAPSTADPSNAPPAPATSSFDVAALDALVALAATVVEQPPPPPEMDEDGNPLINHVFISYRQRTEKQFSTNLYLGIKALAADLDFCEPPVNGPNVFLDTKCLKDGEDWEVGFVRGLLSSQMMVALVSWQAGDAGSVAQFVGLTETNDYQDNVLLEWELALVLREWKKSMLKSVFPILIADKDDRGYLQFPFQHFAQLSAVPSLTTKAKLVKMCVDNGIPISEKAVRRSVKDVVAEVTKNQGLKMSDLGAEEVAMAAAAKRIFDKAASIVQKHGQGEHNGDGNNDVDGGDGDGGDY